MSQPTISLDPIKSWYDQYRFIINYTLGCMLVQLNGGFEQLCYTMLYPNTVTEVAQACVSNILSSRRSRHSFIPPYLMSKQKREIVSSGFSAQGIVSSSSAVSSLCRSQYPICAAKQTPICVASSLCGQQTITHVTSSLQFPPLAVTVCVASSLNLCH